MVRYYEVAGSPVERWNLRDTGVTEIERTVVCDWGDRYEVVRAASEGELSYYYMPDQGTTALRSKYVAVEPIGAPVGAVGGDGALCKYEKAAVRIVYHFEHEPPQAMGPRVSESIEPYSETYEGPETEVRVDVEEEVSRKARVYYTEMGFLYHVIYHDVRELKPELIGFIGCVNATPCHILGGQLLVNAGCLLYLGPRIERAARLGLVDRFQVSLSFKSRRVPWNYMWVPETRKFVPIKIYLYDKSSARMKEYVYLQYPPVNMQAILP